MKDKILLLVSHYPDPLINKRLEMLKEKFDTSIFYTLRHNEEFEKIDGIQYYRAKYNVANISLLKRIKWIIDEKKQIKQIIKKINPQYLYFFGLDMLIFSKIKEVKNKKIVYEIADLHDTLINSSKNLKKIILKKILNKIEKKFCKNVNILSLTSEKFYDVYFSKFIDENKKVFMPNIPNLKYFSNYKKKKNEVFTVGFIGGVRYKKQMKLLISAADVLPIKVFFAGYSQDDEIKNLVEQKGNIEYYGRYDYNREIAELYSKCDCIYSIYDTTFNNVKYALPNKLYEAIYCELPILVAENTYLGELVNKWGVGLTVNSESLEDLTKKIELLINDKQLYNNIVKACKDNKEKINMEKYNRKFIEKLNWRENE